MPEEKPEPQARITVYVLAPPSVRALILPPTKGRERFVGGLPNKPTARGVQYFLLLMHLVLAKLESTPEDRKSETVS